MEIRLLKFTDHDGSDCYIDGNEIVGINKIEYGTSVSMVNVVLRGGAMVSVQGSVEEVREKWMGDTGSISDGYHTFDELYDHRSRLFLRLCWSMGEGAKIFMKNSDGSVYEGMFGLSLETLNGQVSYHLDNKYLEEARKIPNIEVYERCDWYDGHTSGDVLARLKF